MKKSENKKPFSFILLGVLFFIILVLIGHTHYNSVQITDVTEYSLNNARQTLKEQGLVVKISKNSIDDEQAKVIKQSVPEGTWVKRKAIIVLTLNNNKEGEPTSTNNTIAPNKKINSTSDVFFCTISRDTVYEFNALTGAEDKRSDIKLNQLNHVQICIKGYEHKKYLYYITLNAALSNETFSNQLIERDPGQDYSEFYISSGEYYIEVMNHNENYKRVGSAIVTIDKNGTYDLTISKQ